MPLPFRTTARKSDTGRLPIRGQVLGKIKKGASKDSGIPIHKSNLNDHFRFAPSDKSANFTDYDTGESEIGLDDVFTNLYSDKPNYIPCNIMGFDHLMKYDISTQEDKIREQISRWAVAEIRNASGMLIIDTDYSGQYVSRLRRNGFLTDVSSESIETPVVLNEQGSEFYNAKATIGIEGHVYNGKFLPWNYVGLLHLNMLDFQARCGSVGLCLMETTSRIDIDTITNQIFDIVSKTNNSVPLSRIPVLLYRAEKLISSPIHKKGQHISQSRSNRSKRIDWGVNIKLDPDFVNEVVAKLNSNITSYAQIGAPKPSLEQIQSDLGFDDEEDEVVVRNGAIMIASGGDGDDKELPSSEFFRAIENTRSLMQDRFENEDKFVSILSDFCGVNAKIAGVWAKNFGVTAESIHGMSVSEKSAECCKCHLFYKYVVELKMSEKDAMNKAEVDYVKSQN